MFFCKNGLIAKKTDRYLGRELFKCVKTILVTSVFNVSAKKHGIEENVVYFIANAAIVFFCGFA